MLFQFLYDTITSAYDRIKEKAEACFNSSMIQLQAVNVIEVPAHIYMFQFLYDTITSNAGSTITGFSILFQFLYDTITSLVSPATYLLLWPFQFLYDTITSIYRCGDRNNLCSFNSSMIQLQVIIIVLHITINMFQFLYDTITSCD